MKQGLKQTSNTLVYGFISEKLIRIAKEGDIHVLSEVASIGF
jgi:hypothetical protein